MRIIQQTELDQVWAESLQAGQVRYHATEFELRADLPPQIAQGWDHQIDLRQGLSIQCLSGKFCQALALDRQHSDQFPLTLKFYLAGNSRVVAPGVQDVAADYEECCGHHYLYCLPDMREMEYYEAEKPLSIVYISLEPEYLKSFCSDGAPLPTTLQRIFHGLPEQRFYKAFGKMSPAIQRTVQQILNCPYGGLTKQVYLESKALELLSMQLVHARIAFSRLPVPLFYAQPMLSDCIRLRRC
ncbi:MAG: hypothetical protein HC790_14120 [Acaryochloridaceae cyanobacterium CSU_3_4]|nr:hypothetical protein [Acaryochloridaceae cyanobacterium CSU_3_4]